MVDLVHSEVLGLNVFYYSEVHYCFGAPFQVRKLDKGN